MSAPRQIIFGEAYPPAMPGTSLKVLNCTSVRLRHDATCVFQWSSIPPACPQSQTQHPLDWPHQLLGSSSMSWGPGRGSTLYFVGSVLSTRQTVASKLPSEIATARVRNWRSPP